MFIGFVGDNENLYRVIHDLWTLLQEDDFLSLCDQKVVRINMCPILDG